MNTLTLLRILPDITTLGLTDNPRCREFTVVVNGIPIETFKDRDYHNLAGKALTDYIKMRIAVWEQALHCKYERMFEYRPVQTPDVTDDVEFYDKLYP